MVGLHHAMYECEPQPQPPPVAFRSEKRVEHALTHRLGNADTGVGYGEPEGTLVRLGEVEGELAAFRHGLRGIEAEIADDLVDLTLVGGHVDGLGWQIGTQLDAWPEGMAAEVDRRGR